MKYGRVGAATWILCTAVWLAAAARADVLVLHNGGRVEGELLNPDESPRVHFVLQTAAGVQITLDAAQVSQRLRPRPAEQEYEKLAPTFADTADAQWDLATWCAENNLLAQRKVHLERIIELNPDHQKARAALGYLHDTETGKWVTQKELMESRGEVYDPKTGRYMLPQAIKLREEKEAKEKIEREWVQKLSRAQAELGGSRDTSARDFIRSLKDPAAIKGLSSMLRSDTLRRDGGNPKNRCLYLEGLASIGDAGASSILTSTAVNDPVEEVRLTCLDYLKKQKNPDAVAYFVSQLHSKDNQIVNRAAVGLSAMGDRSAIGPLIDALTTVHKFKIVTSNSGGPGSMTNTFSKNGAGGGGMAMGDAPKFFNRDLPNQSVLDALAMLTGVNYGFDKRAWHTWYAAQRQRNNVDTRRG
jgi:hypothetical protein